MEKQSLNYKGLTIEVRWSSANACYLVEVFDNGESVLMKFRSSYESDEQFLEAVKTQVDTYSEGYELRNKITSLFGEL